jgi:hypothetical protein
MIKQTYLTSIFCRCNVSLIVGKGTNYHYDAVRASALLPSHHKCSMREFGLHNDSSLVRSVSGQRPMATRIPHHFLQAPATKCTLATTHRSPRPRKPCCHDNVLLDSTLRCLIGLNPDTTLSSRNPHMTHHFPVSLLGIIYYVFSSEESNTSTFSFIQLHQSQVLHDQCSISSRTS